MHFEIVRLLHKKSKLMKQILGLVM
ncbi:hypothetical protein CCP4SC76_4600002 [Gammaproteobacteria bacterium]